MTSRSPSDTRSVIRGTSIVSVLTMLSRVLGLIRDMVLAPVIGSGILSDAFVVAFRIPNLLRSLVAEGALTSAFVPVFSNELQKGAEHAQAALRAVTGLLLIATIVLSGLGVIFAPQIVSVIGAGFNANPEQVTLCVTLTRIMLPYIIFVSLVAMLNGALNTVSIFGAAPLAQVAMNIVLILGAVVAGWFDQVRAVYIVSWTILIGGAVQVVVQLPALRRAQFVLLPKRPYLTPATKQMLWLMLPAVFGAAIYQINVAISTTLASVLRPGSATWLFFADRLAQLPMGVFTIALASVLLPALSHAVARGDEHDFKNNLVNSLRYTSFLIIPVSFGLAFYARPLVSLFFERGNFEANSAQQTAFAVQAMCFGLWGYSCHSMTVRAFIARKDTLTPSLVGAVGMCISLVLALVLMGTPERDSTELVFVLVRASQQGLSTIFPTRDLGHVGLALSSGLSALFTFLLLLLLLRSKSVNLPLKRVLGATLRALLASFGMLAGLYGLGFIVSGTVLELVVGIPTGIIFYSIISYLTKSPELQETFELFARTVLRRRK